MGYLVMSSEIRSLFATAKQIMDRHPPAVEQEALATMFRDGHVKRGRQRKGERGQSWFALRRRFGDQIPNRRCRGRLACGVVVWFRDLPKRAKQR
ncbi:hypothetical protein I6F35_34165 [Bradyrhizobium sp. BRP22]|uniref:hypothetical protein n=1 Tax=Bradyrhizobium sp. BRP22 TaxID=2793821 RepID=UPI001CD58038|nr:hypothetical protein [Bradyrhizobium sp. BRP22]MCA1458179.1 hypothetical protein [Bradyrhizobium sp. BRP22]